MKKIIPFLIAAVIGGISGNFIQNRLVPKEIAPLTTDNLTPFKHTNYN